MGQDSLATGLAFNICVWNGAGKGALVFCEDDIEDVLHSDSWFLYDPLQPPGIQATPAWHLPPYSSSIKAHTEVGFGVARGEEGMGAFMSASLW